MNSNGYIEEESALCGALMLDSSIADRVAAIASSADFRDESLGKLYNVLLDIANAKIAMRPAVIRDQCERVGILKDIGGLQGIATIAQSVAHAGDAVYNAQQIRRLSHLRFLGALGESLVEQSKNRFADPEELIRSVEAASTKVLSATDEAVDLYDAMLEALAMIEPSPDGKPTTMRSVPTGLSCLDAAIGGFFGGELVILAARPSIGKSALGAQFATYNAMHGRRSLFVSLEMTSLDMAIRHLAAAIGVGVRTLRNARVTPEKWQEAMDYVRSLGKTGMILWPTRNATVPKVRGMARILAAQPQGLAMIVVDYIGLLKSKRSYRDKHDEVAEISGDLKELAMEMNIPVVALCQLNREAEKSKPTLAHLRQSGAIEQDADIVMLLHREDRASEAATLDLAKQRNGETGVLHLRFDKSATQFADPELELD